MEAKIVFDSVNVKDTINDLFTMKVLMLKGEKGEKGDPVADSQVVNAVEVWLDEHISEGYTVDNTLTISGAAADAKVTGDAIGDLKSALTEKLVLKQPVNLSHSDADWTSGYYVDNHNGNVIANSSLSYSAKIPVNEGDVITLYDKVGNNQFSQKQIRSIAAYDASDNFVRTSDALGWKVQSYTVPSGVASIIISAPNATQYMVVANTIVTEYEAYFEPYYIATYDFIKDGLKGNVSTQDLKNEYACALPKTAYRQTVGIAEKWYKKSMITPLTDFIFVNAGYSSTEYESDGVSFENNAAVHSMNGYLWYVYDLFFNLLYNFDNNTGYGQSRDVIAENLANCSLLAIGDSTIDQDHITGKLLSYFTEKNKTITLLGTLGKSGEPLNRNEGRAGWTSADYMTNTTKNGYNNPFYNPSTESFDFTYYMTQQNYSDVDFVVIQLGINDLYPSNPCLPSEPNYANIWGNIQAMIDSIIAFNNQIKIIINLPTTPNGDPSKHLIPEFIYRHFVIRYNEYALEQMRTRYSTSNVRPSYCHLILDPETDISDNVHPTILGYEKIALEVVNQINCWQNGV